MGNRTAMPQHRIGQITAMRAQGYSRGEIAALLHIKPNTVSQIEYVARRVRRPRQILTQRELSVLALRASGITPKAIARALGITVYTVSSHSKNARQALGARDVIHSIVIAVSRGLINIDQGDEAMSDIVQWKRPAHCANGACPEVAFLAAGKVALRSSERPHLVAILDTTEWQALREAITGGEFREAS